MKLFSGRKKPTGVICAILTAMALRDGVAGAADKDCNGRLLLPSGLVEQVRGTDIADILARLDLYLKERQTNLAAAISAVYGQEFLRPGADFLTVAENYRTAFIAGDMEGARKTADHLKNAASLDPFFEQFTPDYPRKEVVRRLLLQLEKLPPDSLPSELAVLNIIPGATDPISRVGSLPDRVKAALLMHARILSVQAIIRQLRE